MGIELRPEERMLVRTDGGSTARMPLGCKGTSFLLLLQIAFDGGEADIEHAGDLGLGSASFNGGHNLGPHIGGVCFHFQVCQTDQSLRKML